MKHEELRMRNCGRLCLLFVFHFSFFVLHSISPAYAGEIEVAKEALRDGLWEVARTHAAKVEGDEARLVILESYARERKWGAVLKALDDWSGADGDGFVYYRALALAETGAAAEARAALGSRRFTDGEYAGLVARLAARIELDAGASEEALRILRERDFAVDSDSKMEAARILSENGSRREAERLWAEIAADTNASERAAVIAAVNLGDPALIRRAYGFARSTDLRRLAGLKLGMLLIGEEETFDEGARMIRSLAKDAPDAEGAEAAFLALAERYLDRGRNAEAAEAYRDAVDIWPETAKIAAVNEGRGWALRRLGRNDEALAAFVRAEECASDDEGRATALLEQGDVLSEAGSGAEALARYRKVLEKYPKTSAGEKLEELVKMRELEARGRELFKAYRFEEAMTVFANLVAQDPSRRPRADYFKVLCLYGLGRDVEAGDLALRLSRECPDEAIRAEATLWLAKLSYNRSQWKPARELFVAYSTNSLAKPAKAAAALLWAARAAFADNDFPLAVQTVTALTERFPESSELPAAYLVQGEALIELSRFDEAVLVLERAALVEGASAESRMRARLMRADALFAMGADNPVRYREALDTYRAVLLGESMTPGLRLSVSFKIGRTLEKLKKTDDAINQYYTEVVLAYRNASDADRAGFDDEARAAFVRAAFRLADEYESRGRDLQAMNILELVVRGDVPAAEEARKRIARIQMKGKFL